METGVPPAASDAVKNYIAHLENENIQLKKSITDKEHTIIQFTQQIRSLESENGLLQKKTASGVIQAVWERGGEVC
jgi:hypothetical protein